MYVSCNDMNQSSKSLVYNEIYVQSYEHRILNKCQRTHHQEMFFCRASNILIYVNCVIGFIFLKSEPNDRFNFLKHGFILL